MSEREGHEGAVGRTEGASVQEEFPDVDDPLAWLRDAIARAEGREQGILNQAHNQILKVRNRGTRHWICPTCGEICRAEAQPAACPACRHDGYELVEKVIHDA